MFQLGIRGHDVTDTSDIVRMSESMASKQIENVQLALPLSFPQYEKNGNGINPGMGNYIRTIMKRKEINIAILSCYINMIHPNLIEREKLIIKFKQYLRYASSFGALIVGSETGNVYPEIKYTKYNFSDEAFKELLLVIEDLAKEAEKCGVMLGIEPGLNHPLYSIDRVEELIKTVSSSSVQIILDPANLVDKDTYKCQNEIINEAFRRFGKRIVAVHLKDYIVENNQLKVVPIGSGVVDFEYFITKVNMEKPGCYMIMEETPLKDIDAAKKVVYDILNR